MVVVIGASGFIGTYLVDQLIENGVSVLATGRNSVAKKYYEGRGIPFVELDITSKKSFSLLPKENVDAVILLAALLPANVSQENPYLYVDVNIVGTLNVLEYCRENNIKKIISTTSYADLQNLWSADRILMADENRAFRLKGDHAVYVISKNAATDLILYYNEEYGMQGSIFRLPPVYGVGPHSALYVNGKWYKSGFQVFVDKAKAGEDIEIFGNKDVVRDIVYIKDVVMAFINAINSQNAIGVYNITSGESSSLEEQVKDIIEVFSPVDKRSRIIYRPEIMNNSSSYRFDIEKARKDFGYNPQYVPFKRLVEDYKKEMEKLKYPHLQVKSNNE